MNKLVKSGLIAGIFAFSGTLSAMEKPSSATPDIRTGAGWLAYKCWVPVPAIQWVGSNLLGYEYPSAGDMKMSPCEESMDEFSVVDFSLIKPLEPKERRKYDEIFRVGKELAQGAQHQEQAFDNVTYEQILKDIPRTSLDFRPGFFANKKMAQGLTRVLFAWSKVYPEMGYSQGYNDIAAHLFVRLFDAFYRYKQIAPKTTPEEGELESHWIFQSYEFNPSQQQAIENLSAEDLASLEAHVFTCFDRVLGPFLKATKAGRDSEHLVRMNNTVAEILASADPELNKHLNAILMLGSSDLTPMIVAWNTYFFSRELPPKALAVLWDAYLLDEAEGGFALLHPYVCCALIEALREKILSLDETQMESFVEVFQMLREPPIGHWDLERVGALVNRAKNMRSFRPQYVADYARQLKTPVPIEQDERHSPSFDRDSFVEFVLVAVTSNLTEKDYDLFVTKALKEYPQVDASNLHLFARRLQKHLKEGYKHDVGSAKSILKDVEAAN